MLTHTRRAARAVNTKWKQGLVSVEARPRYSHTCYKLFASGRTWSSGWSALGHPVAMLRRADPCRRHTHFYLWRSSSRAARRSHCRSAAATDRKALVGNHLQRKEKERDSCRFSLGILLFNFHFNSTHFKVLFQLLSKDWGIKSVQAKTLSLVSLLLGWTSFGHVRLSTNSETEQESRSRDQSSLKQLRGFLSDDGQWVKLCMRFAFALERLPLGKLWTFINRGIQWICSCLLVRNNFTLVRSCS